MLTDRERRALVWQRTPYSAPPLRAPRIRFPRGLFTWLVALFAWPLLVPLLVLGKQTKTAVTKRTNRY